MCSYGTYFTGTSLRDRGSELSSTPSAATSHLEARTVPHGPGRTGVATGPVCLFAGRLDSTSPPRATVRSYPTTVFFVGTDHQHTHAPSSPFLRTNGDPPDRFFQPRKLCHRYARGHHGYVVIGTGDPIALIPTCVLGRRPPHRGGPSLLPRVTTTGLQSLHSTPFKPAVHSRHGTT